MALVSRAVVRLADIAGAVDSSPRSSPSCRTPGRRFPFGNSFPSLEARVSVPQQSASRLSRFAVCPAPAVYSASCASCSPKTQTPPSRVSSPPASSSPDAASVPAGSSPARSAGPLPSPVTPFGTSPRNPRNTGPEPRMLTSGSPDPIRFVQVNVGQQRRDHASLRCPARVFLTVPSSCPQRRFDLQQKLFRPSLSDCLYRLPVNPRRATVAAHSPPCVFQDAACSTHRKFSICCRQLLS